MLKFTYRYSIFVSCWADDPIQRPAFKILQEKFERLLGKSAKYLDLEDCAVSNFEYLDNSGRIFNSMFLYKF